MSLNKRDTIRAVARRTTLTHKQAEEAVQALIEVWFEELADGGKITIENFLILQVTSMLGSNPNNVQDELQIYWRVTVRASKKLKKALCKPTF